ncbi:MAG: AmmeMemoRadiSam system protein A [Deltaproteobacteria bacterium]|nr:AmmeMemoRadiSam system protein A [Deltaproteobacteria bacterium]
MGYSGNVLLAYARQVIAGQLSGRPRPAPPEELGAAPALGCFVSLKTSRGKLRGCMGTLAPTRATLAEELAENALAAALRDPRFESLDLDELEDMRFSIDLLSAPENVSGPEELDPARYGLIVSCGSRCGVLLPDIPGVNSVERQIDICREKAGIEAAEEVGLQRFTVERFSE